MSKSTAAFNAFHHGRHRLNSPLGAPEVPIPDGQRSPVELDKILGRTNDPKLGEGIIHSDQQLGDRLRGGKRGGE
jgi:hypothetical protein